MVDYTIRAFPTEYRGRVYRSRLEARWAAFFDGAGWNVEYEPADLGGWSPDFLIRGATGPILAEIKPISGFDPVTADRMHRAAVAANFQGELLLLGTAPDPGFVGWLCDGSNRYNELGPRGHHFAPAPFAFYEGEPDQIDFCHSVNGFNGRITGLYDGGVWGAAHFRDAVEIARELWARATNSVQWLAPPPAPEPPRLSV